MNLKSPQLLVLLIGVVMTVGLSFLPKFVVSDKEKRIKSAATKVKQEIALQSNTDHQTNFDSTKVLALIQRQKNTPSLKEKMSLVDSITKIYRDAFALEQSAIYYSNHADLNPDYYTLAVRDGLTGLRMSTDELKKKKYLALCEKILKNGLSKNPNNNDLLVEQYRLQVFAAALNGEMPMAGIRNLRELLTKHPNLLSGRLALAEFLMTVGKNTEAIEEYKKVIEIDRNNLQARLELVNLHLGLGNPQAARVHLEQLEEVNKIDNDPFITDFIKRNLNKLN